LRISSPECVEAFVGGSCTFSCSREIVFLDEAGFKGELSVNQLGGVRGSVSSLTILVVVLNITDTTRYPGSSYPTIGFFPYL
jgi:hypothetical protein